MSNPENYSSATVSTDNSRPTARPEANPNVVQNPFPNPPNQALAAQPQPYQLAFPTLASLNQPITVKLDQNNFVLWKNQLLNIIIGNGLEEYIDGSYPCPPKFIDPQNRVQNPEFTTWRRFNRNIMSWYMHHLQKKSWDRLWNIQRLLRFGML